MQRDFSALSDRNFDLAVIGGGATGAAIALDASLRGLSVALVDKGDFAAATSAGSSKLMHGGLRYLAGGQIAQVREGLRERRHWSRIAKHLVHPLPFLIPTYESGDPGRGKLRLGLHLYDLLAFDRNRAVDPMQKMPGHRNITAAQVLGLSPDTPRVGPAGQLTGGLMYHDGQMLSPERLVLAMLRTAMQAGAVAVNHAEATGFKITDGRVTGVNVLDRLSRKKATLDAALVINATGPWADGLMQLADKTKTKKKLIRSKGIHLITRNLTRGAALALPVGDEHLFVLPWMGMSVLATTDTKFDDAPDDAAVTKADMTLLLDKANAAMPDVQLSEKDVVYAYVGLRPLVVDLDDAPDATYGLSRGSEIYVHAEHGGLAGLVSALGGKWTTSRRLAEQTVDLAFDLLARPAATARSAETLLACTPRDDLGRFMDAMRAAHPHIETGRIDRLSRLYGRLLPAMLASDTAGLAGLKDDVLAAQVAFAVSDEMAVHLCDVVLRRLFEGQTGSLTPAQIDTIAAYMAARLGWSAAETKRQTAALAAQTALPGVHPKKMAEPKNPLPKNPLPKIRCQKPVRQPAVKKPTAAKRAAAKK